MIYELRYNPTTFSDVFIFGNWSGIEPEVQGPYKDKMERFVNMYISFVKYTIPFFNGTPLLPATRHRVPSLSVKDSKVDFKMWEEKEQFWKKLAQDHKFDWISVSATPV